MSCWVCRLYTGPYPMMTCERRRSNIFYSCDYHDNRVVGQTRHERERFDMNVTLCDEKIIVDLLFHIFITQTSAIQIRCNRSCGRPSDGVGDGWWCESELDSSLETVDNRRVLTSILFIYVHQCWFFGLQIDWLTNDWLHECGERIFIRADNEDVQ